MNENSDETYIDEQLNPMQQIEAGGPPRKVDLQSLPEGQGDER